MAREPDLDAGSMALAQAFTKLSTERQIGMGMGPIPISKVWDWEDREGIHDLELRDFVEAVLMGVDARVCARQRAESEAKRPSEGAPKEPNRPPARRKRR